MLSQLDHIVIGHSNLELAMQEFADLTGCQPAYGGAHQGRGTHNALAAIGDGLYIELISPDPSQPNKGVLSQRLASYRQSQLLAWAVRSSDLEGISGEHCGFATSEPFDMSREQPGSDPLHWRLLNLVNHELAGFAPFYIDWLACPHPATTNPVAGQLLTLELTHPSSNLGSLAAQVGAVEFAFGPPNFVVKLATPKGDIQFRSTALDGFWS